MPLCSGVTARRCSVKPFSLWFINFANTGWEPAMCQSSVLMGALYANRLEGALERSRAPPLPGLGYSKQGRRRKHLRWCFAQLQGIKAVASARLSGPVSACYEVSRLGCQEGHEVGPGPRGSGSTEECRFQGCAVWVSSHLAAWGILIPLSLVSTLECPRLWPWFSPFLYFHHLMASASTTALNLLCLHTYLKFLSPV